MDDNQTPGQPSLDERAKKYASSVRWPPGEAVTNLASQAYIAGAMDERIRLARPDDPAPSSSPYGRGYAAGRTSSNEELRRERQHLRDHIDQLRRADAEIGRLNDVLRGERNRLKACEHDANTQRNEGDRLRKIVEHQRQEIGKLHAHIDAMGETTPTPVMVIDRALQQLFDLKDTSGDAGEIVHRLNAAGYTVVSSDVLKKFDR